MNIAEIFPPNSWWFSEWQHFVCDCGTMKTTTPERSGNSHRACDKQSHENISSVGHRGAYPVLYTSGVDESTHKSHNHDFVFRYTSRKENLVTSHPCDQYDCSITLRIFCAKLFSFSSSYPVLYAHGAAVSSKNLKYPTSGWAQKLPRPALD